MKIALDDKELKQKFQELFKGLIGNTDEVERVFSPMCYNLQELYTSCKAFQYALINVFASAEDMKEAMLVIDDILKNVSDCVRDDMYRGRIDTILQPEGQSNDQEDKSND